MGQLVRKNPLRGEIQKRLQKQGADQKSPAVGRKAAASTGAAPSTGAPSGDPSSGARARVSNAGPTSIRANVAGRPTDDIRGGLTSISAAGRAASRGQSFLGGT